VPAGRINKCSDRCRKIAADRNRRRRWTAKLAKQLADALYKTWRMLPFDLNEVRTDNDNWWTVEKITRLNEKCRLALVAAEAAGWKLPKGSA
jgi:hypothetical protein